MQYSLTHANVPMKLIGPIKLVGEALDTSVYVPLATFETPLWPSTNRGATISRLAGGIRTTLVSEKMTRSVLLQAPNAEHVQHIVQQLKRYHSEHLQGVVAETSRFARLEEWHEQIVGRLLYLRFAITTGEASGHNMVTKAADALIKWLMAQYPTLEYVSISGNYCTDKKASAVNGILGRGKYVIAEITVPRTICIRNLRTTPEKIVDLNIKKNLIGTIMAGSIRSANAHFANMLLGLYLATGQDAANIIEGSQGVVHTEVIDENLYFSVTLPNVIVGTIGNGKHLPFVQENLKILGCDRPEAALGDNSRRLALITAATVLCGELSLLAAQTNPGELTESHMRLERMHSPSEVEL